MSRCCRRQRSVVVWSLSRSSAVVAVRAVSAVIRKPAPLRRQRPSGATPKVRRELTPLALLDSSFLSARSFGSATPRTQGRRSRLSAGYFPHTESCTGVETIAAPVSTLHPTVPCRPRSDADHLDQSRIDDGHIVRRSVGGEDAFAIRAHGESPRTRRLTVTERSTLSMRVSTCTTIARATRAEIELNDRRARRSHPSVGHPGPRAG